jgi:TolA-binding protein
VSRARMVTALALIAGLGGGCASWTGRPAWVPIVTWEARQGATLPAAASVPAPSPSRAPRTEPAQLVERAGELAHDGKPVAARDLYERVVREYPGDPARAGALYALGQLQCDPASPFRDYRVSYATFGRLLAEYPRSTYEADARLWRATLSELLVREEEMARLRSQLQRLKRIEVELERSPR